MRSGRNLRTALDAAPLSLTDWDMRSGRNHFHQVVLPVLSLTDWDMRSGRNCKSYALPTVANARVSRAMVLWCYRRGG